MDNAAQNVPFWVGGDQCKPENAKQLFDEMVTRGERVQTKPKTSSRK
jgi:hypothetical protein